MNSTNVPSNNNQTDSKSELTMMSIGVDKDNLKGYEVIAGGNGRVELIAYIQEQLGPGLTVQNSTLGEDGILRTENGNMPMKSQNAFNNVKNNQAKRNKLQNKDYVKKQEDLESR